MKVVAAPALFSVGYEGRTSAELFETLVEVGVAHLVDVRLTPLSRKPGLSKTKLGHSASAAGITYTHFPALGNPKDNRAPFYSPDTTTGCARYAELLSHPDAVEALHQLEALIRQGPTAVLCFERDHRRCHRQVISDKMSERVTGLEETFHIP